MKNKTRIEAAFADVLANKYYRVVVLFLAVISIYAAGVRTGEFIQLLLK